MGEGNTHGKLAGAALLLAFELLLDTALVLAALRLATLSLGPELALTLGLTLLLADIVGDEVRKGEGFRNAR